MRTTYQIDRIQDVAVAIATVREVGCDTFVTLVGGQVIQLGVPLCEGCDEAVVEGEPCSCEVQA